MEWLEDDPMVDHPVEETHRFGGTVLLATVGRLIDQPVDALVVPANQRGMMAVGTPRAVRALAGERVERDVMAQAPLPLGSAVRSAAGGLEERGIRVLFHAVVTVVPGEPARMSSVRGATADLLQLADEGRIRSLALPVIGSTSGADRVPFMNIAVAIIETVIAYLRRTPSRIERIVLVTSLEDERHSLNALLRAAYQHQWIVSE